jgi:hypothetical protein
MEQFAPDDLRQASDTRSIEWPAELSERGLRRAKSLSAVDG